MVVFPSVEFFQALGDRMKSDPTRFEKLGYCDTRMGVRVLGQPERLFALTFEVYECTGVEELKSADGAGLDFVLEGDRAVWREMIENIRKNGAADAEHSLNSLSHLGERLRVAYDDPEGHDKFYRYMATLQAFFDLASELEVSFQDA